MDQAERTALIRFGHHLEDEHATHVKRAALLLDAESRWLRSLNKHDRRNREFVLLALKSEKVPEQLKWGSFDRSCSKGLQNDREIFLQRLELDDFETRYVHARYRVPQVFHNDKEVMLKVLSKHSQALSLASKELQNDRDVVMTAIRQRQPYGPQAIQHASKKLRGDRRVVRTALRHGHGIKAFKFLDRKLQEDYKLALLAVKSSSKDCNESYEVLSELPEEMLDEADIVYEAVKRRGSNLRFVNCPVLLDDIEIILAACENDGTAFQYCPKGPARNEMFQSSNLVMLIENGGWSALNKKKAPELLRKRNLLILAVKNGMTLPADFTRKLCKEDRSLLLDILRHSCKPFQAYYQLPDDIRRNPRVGLAIFKRDDFDENTLASRLSKDVPGNVARKHIAHLMRFAKNGHAFAGGDIWDEKVIVISLCKFDGENFEFASDRLKADPDVARAAFSGSVSSHVITLAPKALFQQHHDIAAMAIKACNASLRQGYYRWNLSSRVYEHIGEHVCTQPSVLLEWVRKGWSLNHPFPDSLRFSDTDVALEAIKHIHTDCDWHFGRIFFRFPKGLRGNKSFMVSAVEANPAILKLATTELFEDFDFMIQVVCLGRDALKHLRHKGKEFDYLANFATQVRARLAATDRFLVHFLGAIALNPPEDRRAKRRRTCRGPANRCHLRMLDIGDEAGSTIKRMIAEFAGIPIGPELKSLHSALDTLVFWGY